MSSSTAITPVKISLTGGDYYTLWAPQWREHGSEWQAFLGDDTSVFVFDTPAEMLVFLESGADHDLKAHPKWENFAARGEDRVVPRDKESYDIIGAPAHLAERPSYENVTKVAAAVRMARSLATVTSAEDAVVFFASHSILNNLERGPEHYSGEPGMDEWTGLGRVVLTNWKKVVTALDEQVSTPDFDESAVDDARARIDAAVAAAAAAREEAEAERKEKEAAADPYDSSPWAAAGIDPVRVTIDGSTLYTLRTYFEGAPVFLGRYGEIFTFNNSKTLVRWMIGDHSHDLERFSTWEDLVTLANAGELEVEVHADNSYSFAGIAEDIEKGVDAVDPDQMARAYELMADAADWAGDDSINSFFLANPRMQDYISYMIGSSETSGYTPTPPFTDRAEGWKEMEQLLVKRFSRS